MVWDIKGTGFCKHFLQILKEYTRWPITAQSADAMSTNLNVRFFVKETASCQLPTAVQLRFEE